MAYSLTINSISPTSVEQKSGVGLIINFTLSGSGISLPGCNIVLYSSLTGGTAIKTLYYEDFYDLISGNAVTVSFADVSPGTYYIDVFYRAQGSPRKAIQVTGGSAVRNIKVNGTTVTSNSLNNVAITNETVNGTKVYG